MDNLKYKGYIGTIQFSENDNCFYGKVLGMKRACITYEGESTFELFEDFKGAVDMYLDHCQRKGVEPEQPYNGILSIRVSSDIHVKMAMYVERRGTNVDSFVSDLIEKRLEAVS